MGHYASKASKSPKATIILNTLVPLLTYAFGHSSALADTQPSEGISYERIVKANPPQIFHIVRIEARTAAQKLTTTDEVNRRLTVSDFAALYDCDVAVNASFFELKDTGTSHFEYANSDSYINKHQLSFSYLTWGPAASNGTWWASSKAFPIFPGFAGYLKSDESSEITISQNLPVQVDEHPRLMVSGLPILLTNGQRVDLTGSPEAKEPRTAVGLTHDGDLLVVVVEGRNPGVSEGLDFPVLQDLMLSLGAYDALNLDGGASSALFIRSMGGLVSRPSHKGVERVVANHLGICTGLKGDQQ